MTTPRIFIAFAPQGVGLLCAIVYVAQGRDLYGWWVGARNGDYSSAYFKLENFYSAEPSPFFATKGSDIYGGWQFDYAEDPPELDKPVAVDEEICHQLDKLQDEFAAEWLFFRDSADSEEDEAAYRREALPMQDVNVKSKQLNKFDKSDVVWRYFSRNVEDEVIEYLALSWPLDYGQG